MDLNTNITYVEKLLLFFNLEHRDISVLNFILMIGVILYLIKKLYNYTVSCKDIDCVKINSAIGKMTSLDGKINRIENTMIEMKQETEVSHEQLRRDLNRFDRYLEELQKNTFELHGVLIGSIKTHIESPGRRIIHEDD